MYDARLKHLPLTRTQAIIIWARNQSALETKLSRIIPLPCPHCINQYACQACGYKKLFPVSRQWYCTFIKFNGVSYADIEPHGITLSQNSMRVNVDYRNDKITAFLKGHVEWAESMADLKIARQLTDWVLENNTKEIEGWLKENF